jgi:quercetin dioxygenase-like cupin family protein
MEEKRPFWLDMDGGDTIQFLDQVYRVKASGAQTGGLFGLVEVSTPQGSGPPPHVHEREDEAFYVLEGSYQVTVGNDRFDAREGFFVFAPRRVPHGYVVRAAPARHLGFVFRADGRRSSTMWSGRRATRLRLQRWSRSWRRSAASRCSARRLLRECRRHDRTVPGLPVTPAALVVRVVGRVRVGRLPGGNAATWTRPARSQAGSVPSRPGRPAAGGPRAP